MKESKLYVAKSLSRWLKYNAAVVSIAVVLFVQIGSSIWWTAVLSKRVEDLERIAAKHTVVVERIPVMEEQDKQILRLLDRVTQTLEKLNDRLWEHHLESMKPHKDGTQ